MAILVIYTLIDENRVLLITYLLQNRHQICDLHPQKPITPIFQPNIAQNQFRYSNPTVILCGVTVNGLR